jgi:Tol biopolymer transport system component
LALSPGARLGPYEILSALGAGGMGEVYRARDTKLDREVAIKVLPEQFVADPERVARFQREAKTLAALNHPHIGGIYGLEDADGVRALVLELVEGPTLADRIAQGPIPLEDALTIARQIADALEAAHEQGIIHRDLKPANIKLRSDGTVKVLDFGLAKALEPMSAASPNGTASPTITTPAMMTGVGMILGTAAYMSPEQAKGRPADKRSDVWAFGCVLFEMLSGKRPFEGEDVTDIIAAVVRAEPDWSALPPQVPLAIPSIIKRCLEKDRKTRIPDMSVVRFMMTEVESAKPSSTMVERRVPPGWIALVAGTGMLVGIAIAAATAWSVMRFQPAPRSLPARFAINLPASQGIAFGGPDRTIAISPDGAHIAYISGASGSGAGGGQLMVRSLDQLEGVPLRGLTNARSPFISPDSRWIGFFESGDLKKVPMTGGPAITISRIRGGTRGSSWGPDDTIIFATNDASSGLSSVPVGGGEPRVLTKPDTAHGELDHFFPSILPGGRAVLFTVWMTSGAADNSQIAVLDLKTGQRKTLVRGGSHAEYVDPSSGPGPMASRSSGQPGYLVYASSGALRAVRFDPEHLEVLSDSVVVADQVTQTNSSGAANFSVSRSGTLLYVAGGSATSFERRSLVWVDRQGREQAIDAPPRAYTSPRISPDGTRIAVSIPDQEQDIWIIDRDRQPLTRLTFGPYIEQAPVWAADGHRIFFASNRDGIPNVFWQRADNTGTMERLTNSKTLVAPYSISPDGKMLVVNLAGVHIGVVHLDDRHEVAPLIQGPGTQSNAEISPDGHWLAYQSDESGQGEVLVRPFPNVDTGRWQISSGGGARPVWARNGQELFYLGPERALVAVPIRTSPTFTYGNPTTLFKNPLLYVVPPARTYDVSPDGRRFLMVKEAAGIDRNATPANMVVVLNWTEELKQRVPTR